MRATFESSDTPPLSPRGLAGRLEAVFDEILPGKLWTARFSCPMYGIDAGRYTTVARLDDDGLWIHSPDKLTPDRRAALEALGTPRWFVCPNALHDRYIEQPFDHYPEARVYAPVGAIRARPHRAFAGPLADAPHEPWKSAIDQMWIRGHRLLKEVVFLHRESGTLILADLAFHGGPRDSFKTRLVAKALGVYDRLAPPRLFHLGVSDGPAFSASIRRMLSWDFDRVIVGHGWTVETSGKAMLREAFANWL